MLINRDLQHWKLFQDLNEEQIQSLLEKTHKKQFKAGEYICTQGEIGKSLFLIESGRVEMRVTQSDSKEKTLNILKEGDHFGEMALLSDGIRTASAITLGDTDILEINKKDFFSLLKDIPNLSVNVSRTISGWLQNELKGRNARKKLTIVSLLRCCEVTQNFAAQVIDFFKNKDKNVALFTDRKHYWDVLNTDSIEINTLSINTTQKQILKRSQDVDHVIVDIDFQFNAALSLMEQCERNWCFIEQTESATKNDEKIHQFINDNKSVQDKTQIIWVQKLSNHLASTQNVTSRSKLKDLRFQFQQNAKDEFTLLNRDLTRLYHKANNVQVGIALGGGGARAFAHIGVLTALTENGIYFDRIAGTSGGALVAAFHASGFDSDYILKLFEAGLKPPKWIKYIPQGNKWYLLVLFRFGVIGKRLKQAFGEDTHFDQLILPAHIIATDLISGKEVSRNSGNVAESVLESMNHPLLGLPILRDGQAMVDGGILNNVPSSVLRENGVDYIVSVSIGAQLQKSFGKSTDETQRSEMKKTGVFGTLFRVLEVGQHGLEKSYEKNSDFLILPDTSAYQFEDFSKDLELMKLGYDTTIELMPELKASYLAFLEDA